MKRLTLALMSLMTLVLTMGTTKAADFPTSLAAPVFSVEGSTVAKGTALTISSADYDQYKDHSLWTISIIYVIDGEDAALGWDDMYQCYPGYTSYSCVNGPIMINKSMTIKARVVMDDGNEEIVQSEIVTVTYTVEDSGESGDDYGLIAPTFNLAEGEVSCRSQLEITSSYGEDSPVYLFYVIDGADDDLTMEGAMSGKCEQYSDPIVINRNMTVKARMIDMTAAMGGGAEPMLTAETSANAGYSAIVTASYTTDCEADKSVPKLTLSASEVMLPAAGQAVFSCTIDPQEYQGTENYSSKTPNGLVGFAIQGTTDDVKQLEYQVGETINEYAWRSYPATDWNNFGQGAFVAAYPGNGAKSDGRLLSIADGKPVTVHYRVTLKLQEAACAAPTMTFVAVATTAFDGWSMTEAENPLTEAKITFTVNEAAKPTSVVAPVFNPAAGEVEPNTALEITSATPDCQIVYVMVQDGEADQTIDLSDPESYSIYNAPVGLRKSDGVTVKAQAFRKYDDDAEKMLVSTVSTARYTFPAVAAPTFSPEGGLVEYGTVVYIYGDGESAIYYTIDGTEPTTASAKYNSENALHLDKVIINAAGETKELQAGDVITIKAISVLEDGRKSNVSEQTYTIRRGGVMTMNPDRTVVLKGETFEFEVTLDPKDWRGFSMYYGGQVEGYEAFDEFKYRKKGETAWTDLKAELDTTEGTIGMKYGSGTADDITWEYVMKIKDETDVESIRLNIGYTPGSDRPFAALDKTLRVATLAVPTFSPASGTVASGTEITLSTTETEAEIRYTTDGSEPTAQSTKYETPIAITTFTTIKAVTVKYGMCSKVAEAVYTLVAAPTFSPASGVVERNSTVTLVTATAGAKIYYTTDGTEPTAQSTEYTMPITIDKPMTIKAIAINGTEQSLVAEAVYVFVKAPEFSQPAGKVLQNTPLTLTAAEGAKIYYTTDGTEPTDQSTEYTAPIQLARKTTIKAIAVVGVETSLVAEAAYVITPIAPTFSIPAGAVESGTAVALTAVGDAEIRFNVMGVVSAISPLYKNPIKIDREKTISAAAFLDGEMSEIVTGKYTIFVNEPVFTPKPGQVEKGTKVTIESGRASIRYTIDGSEPTDKNGRWYNPNAGVIIDSAMTIKAYAIDGSTKSATVTAVYWLVGGEAPVVEVAAPTFSVPAGEVEKDTKVSLSTMTLGADIYYTVDGSEPTAQSTEYKEAVTIDKSMTIKAIAILGENKSEVATAVYTVKGGDPVVEVATPTFTPGSGEVEKGTQVEIACATENAKIYYTVDGSEPTAQSTEYKEAVVINEAMTLKAIAFVGESKSEVATAAYTVKEVANEELELAGVSVYPNPSDGEFTLDLPVAATVEVFASTGVLRQRVETGAGVMTLNIDRSGIYFLRITADGRTTVKRVVVR